MVPRVSPDPQEMLVSKVMMVLQVKKGPQVYLDHMEIPDHAEMMVMKVVLKCLEIIVKVDIFVVSQGLRPIS
jgi:hypothetical protein